MNRLHAFMWIRCLVFSVSVYSYTFVVFLSLLLSYLSSTHGAPQSLMMARMDTRKPTKLRDMMLIKYFQYSSRSSQLLTSPSTDWNVSLKFWLYSGELGSNMQVLFASAWREKKRVTNLASNLLDCCNHYYTTDLGQLNQIPRPLQIPGQSRETLDSWQLCVA